MIGTLEHAHLPEADSLDIFAACVTALHLFIVFFFVVCFCFGFYWNQVHETALVRCCSCAMRLVEQPKTKRLGHPEWFS